MRRWIVYGLVDPRTDTIRYVGCTSMKWLSSRLSAHCTTARREGYKGYESARSEWIRDVLASGHRPTITPLQTSFTAEESAQVEDEWIQRLKPQIVNQCDGGPGARNPAPDILAKKSAMMKARWAEATDEQRRAVGDRGRSSIAKAQARSQEVWKGRQHTPEARAKMAEAKRGVKASAETRAKMSATQKARRAAERGARSSE